MLPFGFNGISGSFLKLLIGLKLLLNGSKAFNYDWRLWFGEYLDEKVDGFSKNRTWFQLHFLHFLRRYLRWDLSLENASFWLQWYFRKFSQTLNRLESTFLCIRSLQLWLEIGVWEVPWWESGWFLEKPNMVSITFSSFFKTLP